MSDAFTAAYISGVLPFLVFGCKEAVMMTIFMIDIDNGSVCYDIFKPKIFVFVFGFYFGVEYIRIRIRFLFLSRIHSYSYSVFIFQPNIFVFVFGLCFQTE